MTPAAVVGMAGDGRPVHASPPVRQTWTGRSGPELWRYLIDNALGAALARSGTRRSGLGRRLTDATVPGGAAVRSGVHAAPQRASRTENRKLTAGMPPVASDLRRRPSKQPAAPRNPSCTTTSPTRTPWFGQSPNCGRHACWPAKSTPVPAQLIQRACPLAQRAGPTQRRPGRRLRLRSRVHGHRRLRPRRQSPWDALGRVPAMGTAAGCRAPPDAGQRNRADADADALATGLIAALQGGYLLA
jgi:hypothetical protein